LPPLEKVIEKLRVEEGVEEEQEDEEEAFSTAPSSVVDVHRTVDETSDFMRQPAPFVQLPNFTGGSSLPIPMQQQKRPGQLSQSQPRSAPDVRPKDDKKSTAVKPAKEERKSSRSEENEREDEEREDEERSQRDDERNKEEKEKRKKAKESDRSKTTLFDLLYDDV